MMGRSKIDSMYWIPVYCSQINYYAAVLYSEGATNKITREMETVKEHPLFLSLTYQGNGTRFYFECW